MRTPTLHTRRLRLESIGLQHAASLQPLFADPLVLRFLSANVPNPYPDDGMHGFLENVLLPQIEAGVAMAWAIVPTAVNAAVGVLEWRREPSEEGDRGFWLGRPYWGQGLMTEAVTAFQDFVFFEVGLERMELRSGVDNHGSSRLKEKTGCVKIGQATGALHEGDLLDVWEITRERWATLRGR